jgi:hypothetical protein
MRKSNVFNIGKKMEGTMFTVMGPGDLGSWSMVRLQCDCGKEVVLPYQQAYYRHTYSCGCRKRPRANAIDYTGTRVYSRIANRNRGRTLVVLGKDEETGRWQYVCDCCAGIFLAPQGMSTGLGGVLKSIATETCPNYRKYTPAEWTVYICNQLVSMGWLVPHTLPGAPKHVHWDAVRAWILAPYYDPQFVERNKQGDVTGLYGLPDIWRLPREWKIVPDVNPVVNELVPEDPDGFGKIY